MNYGRLARIYFLLFCLLYWWLEGKGTGVNLLT